MKPRQSEAVELERLADACLSHLAENPEELLGFMQATGYEPSTLRAAVGGRALQRGLIDYVAQNEPLLLAVSANAGISAEAFMRVWHRLNRTE